MTEKSANADQQKMLPKAKWLHREGDVPGTAAYQPAWGCYENSIKRGKGLTQVEKYVGEIKGGLRPTMKITIMGVIYPTPKSFSVALLCDPKDDHTAKDIGLLLVVSFSDKSIVRNSQIAGKWGKEEKTIPYFPFTAEDSFKMELLCEHQQIRILLDGRQLFSFSHRVQPVQRMTVLQISGDLKLTKVA